MGDHVCLVRSFSQPAEISSRETNEAVPHHVLTESVSFGRFASESLAWEKWSAFTQNRYLEEVERFTKPGSVAQKTAFFEAHFRNRAAGRTKTAKIEKEVNVKTSDDIVCKIPKAPELPLVLNNGMAMSEVRHVEVSNTEVDSTAPSISVMDETTDVQSGEVDLTTSVDNVNSSMAVPEGDALDEDNSTSLSKKRRPGSSGSKTCSKSSKLDLSLKKTRKEPPSSSSKRSISLSKNQTSGPFHMSINCAPSGNTDKTIVKIPQNGSRSSTNGKGEEKADKKKRSGPSSVHMSPNFASSARQTTKTSPKKLARNSTTQETSSSNARNSVLPKGNDVSKSRKRPLPRTTKEGSNAAKCSTSASAFRLPELPLPNSRPSDDKRKNITIGSSVSCSIPNNVQRQPSAGCENLSSHSRVRAKSLTVSSPFNFRSDERAEKRKEFFKKLEAKNNKKEDAVKEQFSCGFKANQSTHFASEKHKSPQVGGFQVPLTSLNSPRLYRNRTPGTENIKNHQSPQMITASTKTPALEKHKRCKIYPSTRSQTKKKTQENVSPNILQK